MSLLENHRLIGSLLIEIRADETNSSPLNCYLFTIRDATRDVHLERMLVTKKERNNKNRQSSSTDRTRWRWGAISSWSTRTCPCVQQIAIGVCQCLALLEDNDQLERIRHSLAVDLRNRCRLIIKCISLSLPLPLLLLMLSVGNNRPNQVGLHHGHPLD